MIIGPVPAVALGVVASCLVVGVAVYLVTFVVLTEIAKRIPSTRTNWQRHLTDENMEKTAIVVSIFAALLSVLLVIKLGLEYGSKVWIPLTVLGLLVGVLSFIVAFVMADWQGTRSSAGTRPKPPPDHRMPPGQPPRPGPKAPTSAPPTEKQDYYRILLAKAMYDKSLADRILDEERKRWPSASFDDLCKIAIERLERDGRRTS